MMHDLHLGRYVIKRYEVRLALLSSLTVVALWLLAAHLFRPDFVILLHVPPKISKPTEEQMRGLPNNDKYLHIAMKSDGSLTLNNEPFNGLSKYQDLTAKLREVFEQRLEYIVLDDSVADREDLPIEKRVARSAVIIAPPSARYGDVLRMIDAVKSGGFDDLWIQIDGTDFWWTYDMLWDKPNTH